MKYLNDLSIHNKLIKLLKSNHLQAQDTKKESVGTVSHQKIIELLMIIIFYKICANAHTQRISRIIYNNAKGLPQTLLCPPPIVISRVRISPIRVG